MSFDPYQQWFGIPPSEQPPTLYRLLGVDEFESDPDKLHQAALLRIAMLRKYQAGKYSDLSQQLMNEVSQARIILLDANRKSEYDLTLAAQQAEELPVRRPASRSSLSFAAIGLVVVALTAGTAVVLLRSNGTTSAPSEIESTDPADIVAKTSTSALIEETSKSEEAPAANPASETKADKPKEQKKEPPSQAAVPFSPAEVAVMQDAAAVNVLEEANLQYLVANPLDVTKPRREGETVSYTLAPGQNQSYFLPVPEGDFRTLLFLQPLQLEQGQNVELGVYQDPKSFVGLSIRRQRDRLAVLVPDPDSTNGKGKLFALQGTGVWLEVNRTNGTWFLAYSDGRRKWQVQQMTASLQPVVIALTLSNLSSKQQKVQVAEFRVEAQSKDYASRLTNWPPVPLRPSSEERARLFDTQLESTSTGLDRLVYSPELPTSVAAVGGALSDDQTAILVAPDSDLTHGPLSDIRQIQLVFQCVSDSRIEFRFSEGGVVAVDADNQQVIIGKKEPAPVSIPVGQLTSLRISIGELGNVAVVLGDRVANASGVEGLGGTMSTHYSGSGPLLMGKLLLDGRVNLLPLWMEALAGKPNRLTDPKMQAPSAPTEPYVVLRTADESPSPWKLEVGQMAPLAFLNTETDEDNPFLEADGLTLHFTRKSEETVRLLAGRRNETGVDFTELAKLNGLPGSGNQYGITLSPDGRTAIFSSDHEEGPAKLYLARRESTDDPFGSATALPFLKDEETPRAMRDPQLVPNGSLYFTVLEEDGPKIYRADPDTNGDFTPAKAVTDLPKGYRNATLMQDDQNLYLQGSLRDGKQAIFRSWRRAVSSNWSRPNTEVKDATGKRGVVSPYVTPDGQFLFFASDREGGKGGLDLWVMRLKAAPAGEQTQTEMVTRAPVDGRIDQWLTLGPFDPKQVANSATLAGLRDFVPYKLFRDVPVLGEEFAGQRWQLGTISEPGRFYLIVLPLDLQKTAEMKLQVRSAPGGIFLWLDREPAVSVFAASPFKPGGPANEESPPLKRFRGKHRIVGVACMTESKAPLDVRIVDAATGKPVDGLVSELPIPASQ